MDQADILAKVKALAQGTKTARQFVADSMDLITKCRDHNIAMADQVWAHNLLSGMTDKTAAKIILATTDLSDLGEVIKGILKTDFTMTTPTMTAQQTNGPDTINHFTKPHKTVKRPTQPCKHCGKTGHWNSDCWTLPQNKDRAPKPRGKARGFRQPQTKRFEGQCYKCNKVGHKASDCRSTAPTDRQLVTTIHHPMIPHQQQQQTGQQQQQLTPDNFQF